MNKAEMNFIRIGLFFSCVLICGLNCDSESAKLNNDVEDEDLTSEQESYVKDAGSIKQSIILEEVGGPEENLVEQIKILSDMLKDQVEFKEIHEKNTHIYSNIPDDLPEITDTEGEAGENLLKQVEILDESLKNQPVIKESVEEFHVSSDINSDNNQYVDEMNKGSKKLNMMKDKKDDEESEEAVVKQILELGEKIDNGEFSEFYRNPSYDDIPHEGDKLDITFEDVNLDGMFVDNLQESEEELSVENVAPPETDILPSETVVIKDSGKDHHTAIDAKNVRATSVIENVRPTIHDTITLEGIHREATSTDKMEDSARKQYTDKDKLKKKLEKHDVDLDGMFVDDLRESEEEFSVENTASPETDTLLSDIKGKKDAGSENDASKEQTGTVNLPDLQVSSNVNSDSNQQVGEMNEDSNKLNKLEEAKDDEEHEETIMGQILKLGKKIDNGELGEPYLNPSYDDIPLDGEELDIAFEDIDLDGMSVDDLLVSEEEFFVENTGPPETDILPSETVVIKDREKDHHTAIDAKNVKATPVIDNMRSTIHDTITLEGRHIQATATDKIESNAIKQYSGKDKPEKRLEKHEIDATIATKQYTGKEKLQMRLEKHRKLVASEETDVIESDILRPTKVELLSSSVHDNLETSFTEQSRFVATPQKKDEDEVASLETSEDKPSGTMYDTDAYKETAKINVVTEGVQKEELHKPTASELYEDAGSIKQSIILEEVGGPEENLVEQIKILSDMLKDQVEFKEIYEKNTHIYSNIPDDLLETADIEGETEENLLKQVEILDESLKNQPFIKRSLEEFHETKEWNKYDNKDVSDVAAELPHAEIDKTDDSLTGSMRRLSEQLKEQSDIKEIHEHKFLNGLDAGSVKQSIILEEVGGPEENLLDQIKILADMLKDQVDFKESYEQNILNTHILSNIPDDLPETTDVKGKAGENLLKQIEILDESLKNQPVIKESLEEFLETKKWNKHDNNDIPDGVAGSTHAEIDETDDSQTGSMKRLSEQLKEQSDTKEIYEHKVLNEHDIPGELDADGSENDAFKEPIGTGNLPNLRVSSDINSDNTQQVGIMNEGSDKLDMFEEEEDDEEGEETVMGQILKLGKKIDYGELGEPYIIPSHEDIPHDIEELDIAVGDIDLDGMSVDDLLESEGEFSFENTAPPETDILPSETLGIKDSGTATTTDKIESSTRKQYTGKDKLEKKLENRLENDEVKSSKTSEDKTSDSVHPTNVYKETAKVNVVTESVKKEELHKPTASELYEDAGSVKQSILFEEVGGPEENLLDQIKILSDMLKDQVDFKEIHEKITHIYSNIPDDLLETTDIEGEAGENLLKDVKIFDEKLKNQPVIRESLEEFHETKKWNKHDNIDVPDGVAGSTHAEIDETDDSQTGSMKRLSEQLKEQSDIKEIHEHVLNKHDIPGNLDDDGSENDALKEQIGTGNLPNLRVSSDVNSDYNQHVGEVNKGPDKLNRLKDKKEDEESEEAVVEQILKLGEKIDNGEFNEFYLNPSYDDIPHEGEKLDITFEDVNLDGMFVDNLQESEEELSVENVVSPETEILPTETVVIKDSGKDHHTAIDAKNVRATSVIENVKSTIHDTITLEGIHREATTTDKMEDSARKQYTGKDKLEKKLEKHDVEAAIATKQYTGKEKLQMRLEKHRKVVASEEPDVGESDLLRPTKVELLSSSVHDNLETSFTESSTPQKKVEDEVKSLKTSEDKPSGTIYETDAYKETAKVNEVTESLKKEELHKPTASKLYEGPPNTVEKMSKFDETQEDKLVPPLSQDSEKSEEEKMKMEQAQNYFEEGEKLINNSYKKDFHQAYEYFKLAAGMGHIRALEYLGFGYLLGDYVALNPEKALSTFQFLSSKGAPKGQLGLGFSYSSGLAVNSSQAKALIYFSFAALGGNSLAQMVLGYRYLSGVGVESKCETALTYYRKVATTVAEQTSSGSPVVQRIRLHEQAENKDSGAGSLMDDDLLQYYEFLADKGDIQAQVVLGQLYYQGGRGVTVNHERAQHYFLMAAESGNGNALAFLGKMHSEGSPVVEQDNDIAFQYYQKAAEKANPIGQCGLGITYLYGKGVEKDYTKALKYFSLSSDQGWSDAQLHLGIMHFGGKGVRRDYKMAVKYFNLASQGGHVLAFYHLAQMHATGTGVLRNCHTAVELYKNVAERGSWSSMLVEAHELYKNGNVNEALLKYTFLAELGYEVAQTNVAYILDIGESSLFDEKETYQRALLHWTRAASQGSTVARLKMGDYHYYGYGTDIDYETAATHYRLATEQQHNAQAMFNLGYMHENGLGLKRDVHLAKRFYDMAAETSGEAYIPVTLALFKLGMFYGTEVFNKEIETYYNFINKMDLRYQLGPNWDIYLATFLAIILSIVVVVVRQNR